MSTTVAHGHGHGHEHEPGPAETLRESGRRLTAQRVVIWEVLTAEPDAHLSAEELARRVTERLPQVNPSTIYRNLEVLVEDGLVLRTDLGENRAFFEPAHEHPHHHLVCERCGAVAHVHDDVLDEATERIRTATGFRLGRREVTFFGLCRACAAA